MADSQRKKALDALAVLLKTASIETVKVSNERIDLKLYDVDDLPLVNIIPGEERPDPYEVGKHAMWRMEIETVCFFLAEEDDEDTRETLAKEQKDAVGGDSSLAAGGVPRVANCEITVLRNGGEWPLYENIMFLEIEYEKEIANA